MDERKVEFSTLQLQVLSNAVQSLLPHHHHDHFFLEEDYIPAVADFFDGDGTPVHLPEKHFEQDPNEEGSAVFLPKEQVAVLNRL